MKASLLVFITGVAIIAFSSVAFAGGEGCDWKNRGDGHKGMSAEAYKQFKKDHAWNSSEGSAGHGKTYNDKEHIKKSATHPGSSGISI